MQIFQHKLQGIFAPFLLNNKFCERHCCRLQIEGEQKDMAITKALDKNGKQIKKDGKTKYRVRIHCTDSNGKTRQVERTAYGLDEAKQIERELLYSIKKEAPAEKIVLEELYNQYISAKKHEIRESSLEKTKQILTNHIKPYLFDIKINKLTVPVLQEWKQQIEAKGLSITMRKNIYGEFRALLNFAVKMEYLQHNPLLKVGNFKAPLETHKEMQFYTPEEFKKYISSARSIAEKTNELTDWNYYVFFNIAFFTGMRKGEIHALTWNDISDNEIRITKSLSQKLKGEDRITPPKNKSSIRVIQIPKPLLAVLDEHYNRCKIMPRFSDDYIICGGTTPLRDTSLDNANRTFATQADVKHIRIHDFRHSHASLLANNGINIQEIARRLGHSDISMTLKTYSHLYPKESERALKVLNEIKV